MVPSLKRNQVIKNILDAGAIGVTVLEGIGNETGQRAVIRESRGTKQYLSEHSRFHTITAIVYDANLDDIISAIIDTARTGSKEDGLIFVSNIEEAISIKTTAKIRERPESLFSNTDLVKVSEMSDTEKKKWLLNKAKEVTAQAR